MITSATLLAALQVVRSASIEFVKKGFFQQGVVNRFETWRKGLPGSLEALAERIALMAGQRGGGGLI